ncbi:MULTISPECIES: hypothetical protein [unclassified Bradyrhizobium]|uniref:hypothetical protein n=1 Tax=Bradyrhizobium TaxID=374 RepID=UPI0029169616|nr:MULTISPECIES: hypothetical protein [unclassified Bradyrhizobium]
MFAAFMAKLLNHPEVKPLLSSGRLSVDGALMEAWASHKSFQRKRVAEALEIVCAPFCEHR